MNAPQNRTEMLAAQMRHPLVTDEQLRGILANPGTGYCGCTPAESAEVAKAVLVEREAASAKPATAEAITSMSTAELQSLLWMNLDTDA